MQAFLYKTFNIWTLLLIYHEVTSYHSPCVCPRPTEHSITESVTVKLLSPNAYKRYCEGHVEKLAVFVSRNELNKFVTGKVTYDIMYNSACPKNVKSKDLLELCVKEYRRLFEVRILKIQIFSLRLPSDISVDTTCDKMFSIEIKKLE